MLSKQRANNEFISSMRQIHIFAAITYIIRCIRPLLRLGKSVEAFKSVYVVVINVLNGEYEVMITHCRAAIKMKRQNSLIMHTISVDREVKFYDAARARRCVILHTLYSTRQLYKYMLNTTPK